MKPNILGLRTLIYKVADLQAATEWYTQAFGVKPYFNEPFYVGFNIGGYELGLQPMASGHKPLSETPITYWGVSDIMSAVDHMIHTGATLLEKPRDVGGDIVAAAVQDPWGNVIGLILNPGFQAEGN